MPRGPASILLAACCCLVVVGCDDAVEVATALNERQVNRLLVQLHQHDVTSARSESDQRARERYRVLVSPAEEVHAREVLVRYDLPERTDTGLAARFDHRALVPSPTAERARLMAGLGETLSETLERIDGVVQARVHVMLPTDDDLALPARKPDSPTASVLVICALPPSATTEPTGDRASVPIAENEVKRLVSAAVEDLRPEAVTVVYSFTQATASPTPDREARLASAARRPSERAMSLVFLAVVGTLAAAVAVLSLRRRGPLIT